MKKNVYPFTLFVTILLLSILLGCNTLQSVEISGEPTRQVYGQGQDFDLTGLGATEVYKNNTETIDSSALVISGYSKDKAGEQAVAVTYTKKTMFSEKEHTAVFNVTVVPVQKIEITQLPTKLTYKQGDEFDSAGLLVKVAFKNGMVQDEVVGSERLTFSGYSKDASGTQTITANYYGQKTTFDIKSAALTGISVASLPDITEYFTGEDINLTGLAVFGNYDDIGEVPITIQPENLAGFDRNRAGNQTVTITYLGKTAKFPVTYIAMAAIKIDTLPSKLEYADGEELDINGMVLLGTRLGASSVEMIDTSRVTLTGYDKFKAGTQTITATIGGKSVVFKVTVGPSPFLRTWKYIAKDVNGKIFEEQYLRITEDSWEWIGKDIDTRTGEVSESLPLRGTYVRDIDGTARKLTLFSSDTSGTGSVELITPSSVEVALSFETHYHVKTTYSTE